MLFFGEPCHSGSNRGEIKKTKTIKLDLTHHARSFYLESSSANHLNDPDSSQTSGLGCKMADQERIFFFLSACNEEQNKSETTHDFSNFSNFKNIFYSNKKHFILQKHLNCILNNSIGSIFSLCFSLI